MSNPLLSLPKPTDTVASDSTEVSDEEARALSAEVRRDMETDGGVRHFEDLLDQMTSSASRARDTGLPSREEMAEGERALQELCRALDRGVSEGLRSDGFTVRHVTAQTDELCVVCEDRMGNSWQASVPFSVLEREVERFGQGPAFVAALTRSVVEQMRAARAQWWLSGGRS
jgi:hypothetical protein